MTATDIVIGAIGIKKDRTDNENTAIVAMIMLYVFAFNLAWGPLAWAVATELSHGKNKTKIMSVGTAGFWICAWAVTFTLPYLFDADQAGLGPMVGWIYAGGGVISVVSVLATARKNVPLTLLLVS
jgi:SP family sugar:H+ symporter-like MFS transporter